MRYLVPVFTLHKNNHADAASPLEGDNTNFKKDRISANFLHFISYLRYLCLSCLLVGLLCPVSHKHFVMSFRKRSYCKIWKALS